MADSDEKTQDNKESGMGREPKSNNNRRCLIISGGKFNNPGPEMLKADYIIACDKGIEYADELGIRPDVIAGDFDSVSGEAGNNIENRGALVLRFPREKDDTDTLIAVKHALSKGYGELILVCALGNRLDHTLANLQTAHYAAREGALVRLYDDNEEIIAFSNSSVVIPRKENTSLSVFSLDDKSEGVCITGAMYELDNAVLSNTFPIGVSNEFKEEQAAISVGNGSLMVIMSVKEPKI